jgi:3-oxoacyl-[acyl-carrier protein] reductase
MLLKNKNAIITGCNRGIGKSILELFASNGCNIWACSRTPSIEFDLLINELTLKYNIKITPIYFDLSDFNEIKQAIKIIFSEKKTIDILVNNAGITYNALFQMSTIEKIENVFKVNFYSQVILTQYVSKFMIKQKFGSIINIASSAAIDGNSGRSIYGASKAAVICASKSLSEELGDKGIRVNIVAPGITDTNMVSESMSQDVIDLTVNNTNLNRIGKPNDIAEAVLFLASDLSSYITGQVIRVDGGM